MDSSNSDSAALQPSVLPAGPPSGAATRMAANVTPSTSETQALSALRLQARSVLGPSAAASASVGPGTCSGAEEVSLARCRHRSPLAALPEQPL